MSEPKNKQQSSRQEWKRFVHLILVGLILSPIVIVWVIFMFIDPEYVLTMCYQIKYQVFGLPHLLAQKGTRKLAELPNTLKPQPQDYSGGKTPSVGVPAPPPDPPSELKAVVISKRQVYLHWKDNSNNETGFAIRRSDKWNRGETFTVGPNETSFTDCALGPGTNFIYEVGALGRGDSWPNPSVNVEIPELERAGKLLPLTSMVGAAGKCSLTWTGQEFGLGWVTGRTDNERGFKVYFQRLDKSGSPLGGDVQVADARTTYYAPSLAWTGSEYAMVWQDYRYSKREDCEHCQSSKDIFFARISAAGEKIGQEVRISDQDSYYESPRLFWRRNNFFLFWTNGNSIFIVKIDTNGKKIGGPTAIIDGIMSYDDADDPTSIVQSDNTFGMAWISWKDQGELYFEEYDPEKPLNQKPIRISRTCTNDGNCSANGEAPSLFWTGSTYGICWTSHEDVIVSLIAESEATSIHSSKVLSAVEEPCIRTNPSQGTRSLDRPGQYSSPSCVWNGSGIGMVVENQIGHIGRFEWSFITVSSEGNRIGDEKFLVMYPDGNKVMWSVPNLFWNGANYFIPGNGKLIEIEP